MPNNNIASIESYFMTAVPGVFLDRITLTPGGPPRFRIQQNPHLNQNELGQMLGDAMTDVSIAGSHTDKKITKENLLVQLNFSLKAKVPRNKDIKKSWFFDEKFSQAYKILLIKNTSAAVFNNINSQGYQNISQNILQVAQESIAGTYPEVMSIHDTGLLSLTDERDINNYIEKFNKVVTSKGTTVYDVPFSRNFVVEDDDPDHLSFFILPYLDFSNFSNVKTFKEVDIKDVFYGHPIVELVVHNGQAATERRILYDVDNNGSKKLWLGPAHQMANGRWMTGHQHGTSEKYLTEERSDNSLVQDFRSTKRIEKRIFHFDYNKNRSYGMGSLKILNNDDLDIEKKTNYFSNFNNARDEEGNCRFFFSLDFMTMAKKNSTFPKLYEYSDQSVVTDLLKKTKLVSMKIYRREVIGGGCIGKNFETIKNLDPNEILTQVAELNGVSTNGYIKQVRMSSDVERFKSPYMTHYTGIDLSINKIGKYKYFAEIDIEDGTIKFLEDKIEELQNLYDQFNKYGHLSTNISNHISNPDTNRKVKYFNNVSQRFIPEFRQVILNSSISSMAKDETRKRKIKKFIDCYSLLTTDPENPEYSSIDFDNFLTNMSIMTSPVDGTPTGINSLKRMIINLINNIESIMSSMATGPVVKPAADSSSDQTPSRQRAYRKKVIKITKEFSNPEEIFNGQIAPMYGTNYVDFGEQGSARTGLSVMTTTDFLQRTNNEILKYFNNGATTLKISENVELDINETKYSFLSPSDIKFGSGKVLNLLELSQSPKFYITDAYDDAITKILLFNECEDISRPGSLIINSKKKNIEKYSIIKQELRNTFIDYFATKNCTVADMKEFEVLPESDFMLKGARVGQDSNQNYYNEYHNKVNQAGVDTSFDPKNPNVVFSRLIREILTPKQEAFLPREIFNAKKRPNLIENITKNNLITSNHIKALTGLYTPSNKVAESVGKQSLRLEHKDISHNNMGFFFFNFFNLAKVEVLLGYIVSENGEAQMRSPVYGPIDQDRYNFLDGNSNAINALCRFRKSQGVNNIFPSPEKLNFPMYNEYFLMKSGTARIQKAFDFDNQNSVIGSIPTAQELIATGTGTPAAIGQSGEVASVKDILGPAGISGVPLQASAPSAPPMTPSQQAAMITQAIVGKDTPIVNHDIINASLKVFANNMSMVNAATKGISSLQLPVGPATGLTQRNLASSVMSMALPNVSLLSKALSRPTIVQASFGNIPMFNNLMNMGNIDGT